MYDNDIDSENKFENDEFEDLEFSPFVLDETQRIPNPFKAFNPNFQPPNFPGINFPNNNQSGPNFPSGSNNTSFSTGNFNPSSLGAPPNYIPTKNDTGVKSFNFAGPGGPQTKAVSQNSIRFCLYQFTYIWERGGRGFWSFLLNVDRVSVSGLRWTGRRWVYFGLDLRRIDSFICYRNNCENCSDNNFYRNSNENSFTNNKKLYTNSEVRESISKTLISLDIPETKDDLLVKAIGIVDGETIESSIPCIKYRNTTYSINLEVTYPETIDENIKAKITQYANESALETVKIINSVRGVDHSLNPLEAFDECTHVISKALASFSSEFNSKLRDPEIGKDIAREVTHSITQDKVTDNWKTQI
ncbi:MAG: hypothetical protein ACRDA5_09350 [Clostridium sp.]